MKRLTNSKLRGQLLNKAFTLIELLAVIIVLAVVAIVAVPIVLDVVEESRDSANKSTALNILDAGKLYYTESIMDENKKQDIGTGENVYDKLILNGEKPENGKLYISEEGKISLSVVIDNKCYVKSYETELAIYESSAEECNAYVGEDTIKPTISYEAVGTKGNDDWYISGTYVKINVHDVGSGIKSYKWCEGIDCEPTNEETTSKSLYYETSKSVVICAIATDNAGNESETCSETYNIDVDAPTAGTILVNGSEPTTNWYSEDLEITVVDGSDLQSGHLKTEVDVKEITESTSGTKVTVTTYDVAGNTSTREYELKLDKGIPTVTITKEDNSTKLTATVETNNILSNYTYRWYKENTEITGATSSTYIPTEAGKYKVEIITESGIKATSNEIEIKSYKVTYNTNGSNDVVESQNKVEI